MSLPSIGRYKNYLVSEQDLRIKAIISAVPEGSRVLDIGVVQHDPNKFTRDDWLHKHLYEKARYVLGLDIDTEGVSELEKRGFNVEVGDAEQLELGNTFDVITAGEIIEHLDKPGAFLQGAANHLEPNGRLILSTPNPWALKHVYWALTGDVPINPEHTAWYCPRTLSQLLGRYGFDASCQLIDKRPRVWSLTSIANKLGLGYLGATHIVAIAELNESGTES